MSFKTLTLASIYELQGLKEEALEVYKNILKKNPDNPEARSGYERLKKEHKIFEGVNAQARDFFINASTQEELHTFERWLMQWN